MCNLPSLPPLDFLAYDNQYYEGNLSPRSIDFDELSPFNLTDETFFSNNEREVRNRIGIPSIENPINFSIHKVASPIICASSKIEEYSNTSSFENSTESLPLTENSSLVSLTHPSVVPTSAPPSCKRKRNTHAKTQEERDEMVERRRQKHNESERRRRKKKKDYIENIFKKFETLKIEVAHLREIKRMGIDVFESTQKSYSKMETEIRDRLLIPAIDSLKTSSASSSLICDIAKKCLTLPLASSHSGIPNNPSQSSSALSHSSYVATAALSAWTSSKTKRNKPTGTKEERIERRRQKHNEGERAGRKKRKDYFENVLKANEALEIEVANLRKEINRSGIDILEPAQESHPFIESEPRDQLTITPVESSKSILVPKAVLSSRKQKRNEQAKTTEERNEQPETTEERIKRKKRAHNATESVRRQKQKDHFELVLKINKDLKTLETHLLEEIKRREMVILESIQNSDSNIESDMRDRLVIPSIESCVPFRAFSVASPIFCDLQKHGATFPLDSLQSTANNPTEALIVPSAYPDSFSEREERRKQTKNETERIRRQKIKDNISNVLKENEVLEIEVVNLIKKLNGLEKI